MSEPSIKLNEPWLVAVWPGMGNVALTAGYYLMSKMQMVQVAEFGASELFDVDQVEVKEGIVAPAALPRSRFFVWRDPAGRRDIVVFIGEAQPPVGKYTFCHKLLDFAETLGVTRLFTFAAMGTQMHPTDRCRVFGVATDQPGVDELERLEVESLEEGQITGLNGVLLAVGAERGLKGQGLLGEMPVYASQIVFPKASLAVLEIFTTLAGLNVQFLTLKEHAAGMERKLTELLERMQQAMDPESGEGGEMNFGLPSEWAEQKPEPSGRPQRTELEAEDIEKLEKLFDEAELDRSKAYELKQELDRLSVFKQYEDRFLDLFKR